MSLTKQNKHTSTFTKQSKNTSVWDKGIGYLLQEISDYILQENGGKIILSQSWAVLKQTHWTAQDKS